MEKNWAAGAAEDDSVRLTVKALLEVVDSGSKNMEVAVMRKDQPVHMVSEEKLQAIITDIERELEEQKQKNAADPGAES